MLRHALIGGGPKWQHVSNMLRLVRHPGHALSQTGGHGDFRGKGEDCCACGAALRGIGRVCDGDTEVSAK